MTATRQRGQEFLFAAIDAAQVTSPDQLGPEHAEIARTARDFATREARPLAPALEAHDWDASRRLVRRAGDLGLVGLEAPEAYGGLGLDRVTATVVAREMTASGGSFGLTFGVQTGIGLAPLVYFGTPEQKQRYLPGLIGGERIAAYSLTEPGSGSDAQSVRTVARRDPDGRHFVLTGTKQWTTNAGFADLFVVYAKVDGERFTAFLVERSFPGVTIGPEERKMGYLGSSTAQVILEGARVPVENLLHFEGKGHQVAFNTLNIGRFKLAPSSLGSSLRLLEASARFALERRQFGRQLTSFRLIQQKLATMAASIYGLEATTFRLAGLLDGATAGLDLAGDARAAAVPALAEYAVECSIAKVLATETLAAIADEGVQIHGGNGFMRGYEVEEVYRDNRVNRIFEGTNEINRLLIAGNVFRAAARDGGALEAMLARGAGAGGAGNAAVARGLFWDLARRAWERHPGGLDEEQELLALLADIAIAVFAIESAEARATNAAGNQQVELHGDLAAAFAHDRLATLAPRLREALAYLGAGSAAADPLARLAGVIAMDRISLGRRIADAVARASGWPLAR